MANAFDELGNGVIGEVTQDGVTYATAPTPPDGDSSTKVATTEFVKGVAPSGNVAVWSREFTGNAVSSSKVNLYAPPGGTWFCFGKVVFKGYYNGYYKQDIAVSIEYRNVAGGGLVGSGTSSAFIASASISEVTALAIKIA